MKERRTDWIAAGVVFIVGMVLYAITASPTVAFWDCGEFISCSVNLSVPHPPGTPLYVIIGRVFALIPFAREVAYRVNFISILSGAMLTGLIVLLISRVMRSFAYFKKEEKSGWIPTAAGVVGGLFTLVAYSAWWNSLEAELYSISSFIGMLVVYLAVMWRDGMEPREETGTFGTRKPDNRLMLLALYIIFLSAGLHLTPVMMLFALIPFAWMLNPRVLPGLFMGVLALSFMLFRFGFPQIFIMVFMGVYLLVVAFIYFGSGSRTTKDRWSPDMKFLALTTVLLVIAASVHFYLMIRASQHPTINMVNPSDWDRFLSMLRREQYGEATVANQLWPRKTVVSPETMRPTGLVPVEKGLGSFVSQAVVGYWWQMALYFKYLLWQWGLQGVEGRPFIETFGRTLLFLVPFVLGCLGLYSLAKRDRKVFWLLLVTFLLSSFGLVVYLNMRFGYSGPVPSPHGTLTKEIISQLPREVRERDYFYVFSYVFWAVFSGFGFYEFINLFKREGVKRVMRYVSGAGVFVVVLVVVLINYPKITRQGDWIPLEYGYNILASCQEPAVIYTNGDNDTYPVWFVQEVPSTRFEDPKHPYKRGVINANLSLLNIPWYIEELKRKGAPISFVYESKGEELRLVREGGVWTGEVVHPPIKRRTMELVNGVDTLRENRRGELVDGGGEVRGEVLSDSGRVVLRSGLSGDIAVITASYGSGEIDNLPVVVPRGRNESITLSSIMIRDMIATNAGRIYSENQKVAVEELFPPGALSSLQEMGLTGRTRIPVEYLAPVEVFKDSVLARYTEGVMPLYFSTTVSPGLVKDYAPALVEEGLAYRFTRIPEGGSNLTEPRMNVERTYELFTKGFQMTSILDPKVRKDERTKGLLVRYTVTMQELAENMIGSDPQSAYGFMKRVMDFPLEDDIRTVFLGYLYVIALETGNNADAQTYKAELLTKKGFTEDIIEKLPPEYLSRRGLMLYNRGDTAFALSALEKAASYASQDYPDPFRGLVELYLSLGDTAMALRAVDSWDKRYPGDPLTFRFYYYYLKKPGEAVRVLDEAIKNNPDDPELKRFRDSLRNVYNLK